MPLRLKKYTSWDAYTADARALKESIPTSTVGVEMAENRAARAHNDSMELSALVIASITGLSRDSQVHCRDYNFLCNSPHFTRVNNATGLISFYENLEAMIKDKRTETRPGRFFSRLFVDMNGEKPSNCVTKRFSEEVKTYATRYKLIFAHSSDEIRKVFRKGPDSCMSHSNLAYRVYCEDGKIRKLHTVAVYQSPDIELAYMVDTMRENKILGRCLIDRRNPDERWSSIVYGEVHVMNSLLKEVGIKNKGNGLNGCRIRRLELEGRDGVCLMPYIDYADECERRTDEEGDWFVIGDGYTECNNTNGLTSEGDREDDEYYQTCENCEERYSDDDVGFFDIYSPLTMAISHSDYLCDDCRYENYIRSGDHTNFSALYEQSNVDVIVIDDVGYSTAGEYVRLCEGGFYHHESLTCEIEVDGDIKVFHIDDDLILWDAESNKYFLTKGDFNNE